MKITEKTVFEKLVRESYIFLDSSVGGEEQHEGTEETRCLTQFSILSNWFLRFCDINIQDVEMHCITSTETTTKKLFTGKYEQNFLGVCGVGGEEEKRESWGGQLSVFLLCYFRKLWLALYIL